MSKHLQPSFFIIGERKCGTSSLYRYLLEHPCVLPGRRKEMQFFTKDPTFVASNFEEYLQAFPKVDGTGRVELDWPELDASGVLFEERLGFERSPEVAYVTGEASADTLCDGDPDLLRTHLPSLGLIALLRDPVERAFSHHRMLWRFHAEGRALPFVPGEFAADMHREMARIAAGETTPCLSPGLYADNLARWSEVWKGQLLVLFSSELNDSTTFPQTMRRVTEHLGLPAHSYVLSQRYNQAPAASMPEAIRSELCDFFAPHNRALEAQLGRPLPW